MTNPLTPIMEWYRISLDCMNVTTRVINRRIPGAIIRKHVSHNEPESSCLKNIQEARSELDALVVLSMVATFERTLRDYVMERPGRIVVSDDPVDEAIHSAILNDIEYWRIADRLIGIFKDCMTSDLQGQIKQIVGYRNWVAHGRSTAIPPDGNVAPQFAFKKLSEFLLAAGIIDSI